MEVPLKQFSKFVISTAAIALSASAVSACVITQEKVSNIYQGAAVESVEFAIGCELRQVSSYGFGEFAGFIYEAVDARGSIFTAMLNKNKRLSDFHVYLR